MFTIILQLLGWIAFIVASIILGAWLRKNPSKKGAERTSWVLHFLFWAGVAPPVGFGFFYPGLTHFDSVLGLQSLPQSSVLQLLGMTVLLIGAVFILTSNMALWILGSGANAFLLTKRLVADGIYQWTRNPMSLGIYLLAIAIGLLAGSTYLTAGALILFIPAHIFYLKYFEEYELELRLGQSYIEYKQRAPFLLPGFNFQQKAGENHE
jgi:protein-S-isoprenylcysteine O-methyltransferase Ste14